VYERRDAKVWVASVVVATAEPSPKFQLYVVLPVVFLEVLVKVHVNPLHDLVKLAVRTGGGGGGGGAPFPMNAV